MSGLLTYKHTPPVSSTYNNNNRLTALFLGQPRWAGWPTRTFTHSWQVSQDRMIHDIFWVLWHKGEITEVDTDNSAWTPPDYQSPICHLHHFYAGCTSCHNPPNLSWLGIGTKYASLHFISVKISGGLWGLNPPGKHATPTANARKKSWAGRISTPLGHAPASYASKKLAQLQLKLKF